MNIYQEQIIEHYKSPQNYGELEKADVTMIGNNPLCGDVISLKLKIVPPKVEKCKYTAQGCAISIAAASLLSEAIKNKKTAEVKLLKKEDIIELLGIDLGPTRLKCGLLCLDTLKEAVKKYEQDEVG